MAKFWNFLNPLNFLGVKKYSSSLPFIVSVVVAILSEFYALKIANDPQIVGRYIIVTHIALVIYFSFRNGIIGGLGFIIPSIAYYFYIIFDRQNTSQELLTSSVITTLVLAAAYILIASVVGYLKQTIDRLIGQEVQEKKRFYAIINQLPIGIIITDENGKILQSNNSLIEMFSLENLKNIVDRVELIKNLKTSNNYKVTKSNWPLNLALEKGRSIFKKEFVYDNSSNRTKHLQISTSLIRNKSNKVVAAASTFFDITEQKNLEMRKDEFIDMASHELRTPITSLKLYADLLTLKVKKSVDPKYRKILGNIKYQTERLEDLVSTLLDVSRIQTNKLVINKEEVTLPSLVNKTVEEMKKLSKKHKVTFINKIRGNLPLMYADKYRIQQVLENLIGNAIKFSPNGGKIKVALTRKQNFAVVSVMDEGVGIRKRELAKIFNRLYQVSNQSGNRQSGLGMGLYISREIIKNHNGKIWVESKVGKGTTFYFSLPIGE